MRRLYDEGKTEQEIATMLRVTRRHVAEAMVAAWIERRRSGLPLPVSRETLYSLAVGEGLSGHSRALNQSPLSESVIRELYEDRGLSMFHISLVCGVDTMSVLNSLQRHHLPLRESGETCPWYERTYFPWQSHVATPTTQPVKPTSPYSRDQLR